MRKLIDSLSKSNKKFWQKIAKDLAKPSRQRRSVNLSKIDRYSKDGETVIVPGKVLGDGKISKKVTVAGFNFSEAAKKRISAAGGKTITIKELFSKNPEAKEVKILG